MSDYWKNRDVHLKAQKKYDDKNREKKHQYDKLRWQKRKLEHQALLDIKELINKQLLSNTNLTKYTDEMCLKDLKDIVNKALGDEENENSRD